jgi:hypothetical protein
VSRTKRRRKRSISLNERFSSGTGNIQVELDSSSLRTKGSITHYNAPLAGNYITTGTVDPDFNKTGKLHFSVRGPRVISIQATLQPGSSSHPYLVSWNQELQYSNTNDLTSQSSNTVQTASGQSTSVHNATPFYSTQFSYPFTTTNKGTKYTVDHDYDQTVQFGSPLVFKEPSSQQISMKQKGEATMVFNDQGQLVSGNGSTRAEYLYSDSNHFTFTRTNYASNGTVVSDVVGGNLKAKAAKV